jgi:hypothetical protein
MALFFILLNLIVLWFSTQNFVSGEVVVVIRPTLPFDDISLLFGIDMAGDKDIMVPKICKKPSY